MGLREGLFDLNEKGGIERLSIERLPKRTVVKLGMHRRDGGKEYTAKHPLTTFEIFIAGEDTIISLGRDLQGIITPPATVRFLGAISSRGGLLEENADIEFGQVYTDQYLVVASSSHSKPYLLPGTVQAILEPTLSQVQAIEEGRQR